LSLGERGGPRDPGMRPNRPKASAVGPGPQGREGESQKKEYGEGALGGLLRWCSSPQPPAARALPIHWSEDVASALSLPSEERVGDCGGS